MPDHPLTEDIRKMFADKMLLDVSGIEEDLIQAGALDSLRLAELLVHLEENFGYRVAMEELEIDDLRSVASIAALLERHGVPAAAARPGSPQAIRFTSSASDVSIAS